jgi:mRNA-degrading endonuclease HigB of HigAB toxin-antitoxin module
LWVENPGHPSLRFRRLEGGDERFTIRIGNHYRAIGRLRSGTIAWVWIGTHAEYDKLTRRS